MIRNFFVSPAIIGGILLVSASLLHGETGDFEKMYGNGVHAFFSQDYARAHECLSRIMDAQCKDPRCFYFRGLACLKLGREPEARGDFARAADLESRDAYHFYGVSRALERVQGKSRTIIEKYRSKARLAAAAEAKKLRQARYEELRENEAQILQQQAEAAPAGSTPVETAKSNDPFTTGPIEDEPPKAAEEKEPGADAADPFAVSPEQPSKTPMASKAAAPAKKHPVAKKGGGILGAIGKALGKTAKGAASGMPLIGGGSEPIKPQTLPTPVGDDEDPFGQVTPKSAAPQPVDADDKDPFGAEPKEPKAKQPEEDEEEIDPDDPFG